MSADVSERALRRLVAQFAKLRPSDAEAVLSELSVENRGAVETRLKDYRGAASGPPPSKPKLEPSEPLLDLNGLSPWLSEKLRSSGLGGASGKLSGGKLAVTDTALAALRSSAAEMLKLGLATPPAPQVESNSGSLLQRLTEALLPGWSSR